mmetsp:Transcript_10657/g.15987  ORF Transcript_10657/g.15987 Transcript_10657/m.15987 type:complete len:112 (+) Transcript_10657:2624-2959(+)
MTIMSHQQVPSMKLWFYVDLRYSNAIDACKHHLTLRKISPQILLDSSSPMRTFSKISFTFSLFKNISFKFNVMVVIGRYICCASAPLRGGIGSMVDRIALGSNRGRVCMLL